jgi:hypothetical protein
VDAACERVFTRLSEVARIIKISQIGWGVQSFDRHAGKGGEDFLPLGGALEGGLEYLFFPAGLGRGGLALGTPRLQFGARF